MRDDSPTTLTFDGQYHCALCGTSKGKLCYHWEKLLNMAVKATRLSRREKPRPPSTSEGATREDDLFQAANTAAVNLATSMNLTSHPESCECYGCGLQRAVVNFALSKAKENVRPIVERELQAEKWAGLEPRAAEPSDPPAGTGALTAGDLMRIDASIHSELEGSNYWLEFAAKLATRATPVSTEEGRLRAALRDMQLNWTRFYKTLPDGEYGNLGEMRQASVHAGKALIGEDYGMPDQGSNMMAGSAALAPAVAETQEGAPK